MNALQVHTLLHEACRMLDEQGDHAIAAHVGLGMALLEDKYQIDQDKLKGGAASTGPAQLSTAPAERGSSQA